MAEIIKMPKMSDTMTEGTIAAWLKKVGDKVKSGDILAEVETDKATMELENYEDGTLLYIGPKEKESVAVDGVLAIVGKEGEDFSALLAEAQGGNGCRSGRAQSRSCSSRRSPQSRSGSRSAGSKPPRLPQPLPRPAAAGQWQKSHRGAHAQNERHDDRRHHCRLAEKSRRQSEIRRCAGRSRNR